MNTLAITLKYFFLITAELTVLFVGVSALVALALMYLPQEKVKTWMAGRGAWGAVIGAAFGALTPFCACSTIPLALGFIKAGISFSAIMSFIIASPLLNPIILTMLAALMGIKAAVAYFTVVFGGAILFGLVLEKLGGAAYVRRIRLLGGGGQEEQPVPERFGDKVKLSFAKAWGDFRGVLVYLLIGVGIGAAIYGYLPQNFVLRYAGAGNPFAIPVAALIGVPLYIRAETAIPIGVALLKKGMDIGAVIALIIGGAGMAIPEMSMLAGIFRKRLVAAIVGVIFLTAVAGGYLFSFFFG
ncbi:MAG: permease [Elusimicrobia bacterium RIFOXYA12_FULL_57_11]|nr:MAG: permease [Elusimicrobia bacterium RIFOXYA12_FULL_57_11]